MPGDDLAEALRIALGELPDLPFLPELPGRGPGADMIGRAAAMLVDIAVELQPSGWRLASHPGVDVRRALDLQARDLDTYAEVAAQLTGPLKLQVAGPWTLAASVEVARGDKAIADTGAVRDIAASLREGVAVLLGDVHERLPGAELILQIDEPSLPAVLQGSVPTASGYGTLRAVEEPDVVAILRDAVTSAGVPVIVHCCAGAPPIPLLQASGAAAIGLDAEVFGRPGSDAESAIGEAIDAGHTLFLGVLPAFGTEADLPTADAAARPVRELWRRLAFPPAELAAGVVLTPVCGLAGASTAYARGVLARCRIAGRLLVDDPL